MEKNNSFKSDDYKIARQDIGDKKNLWFNGKILPKLYANLFYKMREERLFFQRKKRSR